MLYTPLPPVEHAGNIRRWFRALQFAFHPDRYVAAPEDVRGFVAKAAAVVNTCVMSAPQWLPALKQRAAADHEAKMPVNSITSERRTLHD